eukprot:NODE_560_length_2929_cov_19.995717.p1 GENE.NODE_560_length_2929_cov_19.995717~~NODE_560_length_2929_cov_19.995717.p1  ORF type:complete len:935 (-),score=198.31 NODE_560_length_2929_cov_19.995717:125-2638(-)
MDGLALREKFMRYHRRETFSACVVEKILTIFPPGHSRRVNLEGPLFRERLDFHRYVLFPFGLHAHVTVNRDGVATRGQKAPCKDADIIFERLEVAIDSEQLRSINAVLAFTQEFMRLDELFRTRPRERISEFLGHSNIKQSPQRRAKVVKAWWRHALSSVRIVCGLRVVGLDVRVLKSKVEQHRQHRYLCDSYFAMKDSEVPDHVSKRVEVEKQLRELEMQLPYTEIFALRQFVKDQRDVETDDNETQSNLPGGSGSNTTALPSTVEEGGSMGVSRPLPDTFQVQVLFESVTAYFLVATTRSWRTLMTGQFHLIDSVPDFHCMRSMRELVILANMNGILVEAVQRGREGHLLARWAEIGIGQINISNYSVSRACTAAREIMNIQPFQTGTATPFCLYIALTTYQKFDATTEPGDVTVGSVLEPIEGVAAHIRPVPEDEEISRQERLHSLRKVYKYADQAECKDDRDNLLDRLLLCAFVQVGQVNAQHYAPFWRRLAHFADRGKAKDSVLKHSSREAANRDMLVDLHRAVEHATGKSNAMGIIEGITHGVRGRLVEYYNQQHVLCRDCSLLPLRFKLMRNGNPQMLHLQFYQMLRPLSEASTCQPLTMSSDPFGMLPWKLGMVLLPRADYMLNGDFGLTEPELVAISSAHQYTSVSSTTQILNASPDVLSGQVLLKWNRHGRWQKRFVEFDSTHQAIVWRDNEHAHIAGLLPISSVNDITAGICTPVLEKVRHAKLRPAQVFSIITSERTLDLQADSRYMQEVWVLSLKRLYKNSMPQETDSSGITPLPRHLEKKVKVYPEKLRSDRHTFKQACLRATKQQVSAAPFRSEASSTKNKI